MSTPSTVAIGGPDPMFPILNLPSANLASQRLASLWTLDLPLELDEAMHRLSCQAATCRPAHAAMSAAQPCLQHHGLRSLVSSPLGSSHCLSMLPSATAITATRFRAFGTAGAPKANPEEGHRPLGEEHLERTLLLAKPDSVQRGLVGEIVTRMERRGYKLVGLRMINTSRAQAEAHYADHRDRPFFPRACRFLCSGPVVAMCWEGLDVIAQTRRMIGSTDPRKSEPGTIRGDLGAHFRRNLVHASDSVESSDKELALWFKSGDLVAWDHSQAHWTYELANAPVGFEGEADHPGHLTGTPGTVNNTLEFKPTY